MQIKFFRFFPCLVFLTAGLVVFADRIDDLNKQIDSKKVAVNMNGKDMLKYAKLHLDRSRIFRERGQLMAAVKDLDWANYYLGISPDWQTQQQVDRLYAQICSLPTTNFVGSTKGIQETVEKQQNRKVVILQSTPDSMVVEAGNTVNGNTIQEASAKDKPKKASKEPKKKKKGFFSRLFNR